MKQPSFVLKGTICYSKDPQHLNIMEDSYLVCLNGESAGVYKTLPEKYTDLPCMDYKKQLIIPGLCDLHIHAPQFAFRSVGMDLELLDWLNQVAFPQEARYADPDYALDAYTIFTEALKKSATTRVSMFATLHVEATEILMNLMELSGLKSYVGKVNMDRNSPDYLCEASARASAENTLRWLEETAGRYENVKPILTPRFTPSCSDELMERLSAIQKQYHLPMQSHLSENLGEIAWVQELCPNTRFYGEAYSQFGLFGRDCPTIMAHCVHCPEEEIRLMKEQNVFVAHCPQSNANLSSGIAPVRTYLQEGLQVGLGSDIAGGYSESIFRAMADAIQDSKLRWRLTDDSLAPLTVEEVFYMGTMGGGAFFGKVGSFEEGYEFDAVVLNESTLPSPKEFTVKERLERLIYLSDDRNITAKYVAGRQIF